jgi:hypothetical protein
MPLPASLTPERPQSGRDRQTRNAFVRVMLALLLAYTAWAWAGLRPSFHLAGVGMAGLLLAGLMAGAPRGAWRDLLRDPVWWLGLLFLGFLGLQWANAGRSQYFDVGHQRWTYTPPPWPGWPSAFARADALEMLTWFFPAWVVALAIRLRIRDPRQARGLLMFMACHAGLLAIFGLVQFASGTRSIYWAQPLKGVFFASFAYANHVAPFFVLSGAVAVGLLYRELFDVRRARSSRFVPVRFRHPWRVAVLVPVFLLCLIAANLGFSRAGVILSWSFGAFAAVYGLVVGWRLLPAAGRVNLVALTLGLAGLLYFAVVGTGGKAIVKEFMPNTSEVGESQTVWTRIDLGLGGRPRFALAAVRIWRQHPWFGVGGWGYKYLVAGHIPEHYWELLERRGWANTHFDFLQFLAEFGVAGFGLLLAALAALAKEVCACDCRRDSLFTMGLAGLGLVVVFSLIDLPFRSPAILYAWVALLALLPGACGGIPNPFGVKTSQTHQADFERIHP